MWVPCGSIDIVSSSHMENVCGHKERICIVRNQDSHSWKAGLLKKGERPGLSSQRIVGSADFLPILDPHTFLYFFKELTENNLCVHFWFAVFAVKIQI